jgi:hypothetical protein
MKKVLFSLLAFSALAFSQSITAQDCSPWYPMESGTVMQQTNYNAKGKATGKNVQTIIKKTGDADEMAAEVQSEHYDKKDKLTMTQSYTIHCKDGHFYVDMESIMSPESFGQYESMDVEVDAEDLQIPTKADAGTMLPDAVLTAKVSSSGVSIMTMQIHVTNRKVEGMEKITTPAGTFNCIKLSQTVETKTIMKISMRSIEWYATDTGPVRTESFNKNGKLVSYTELTSLKRP